MPDAIETGEPIAFPSKQTLYPVTDVQVQSGDGTRILTFSIPGEVLIFPLTVDVAEAVGNALAAPSVIVPKNGAMTA